ncbi:hypothetical protein B1R32_101281 [Abditibacterium utsteinense]|uniref:Ferritin-like domain-containing protein n=1 Tax=Abditibacterium utsteinense TaxID=1960156 RepID=A0A2S8SXR9_9BACT|nr:hypothetical protein [Abditibacterium utsteinense]PQV65539.1 hypothetical protein B1R32_101281 [Abditibacterium utsteinense]
MTDTDYPYYPNHASGWLAYFERNTDRESALRLDDEPKDALSPALHAALSRTLARFHLGESGEGTYLKRFAASQNDESYCRAIELFVREEQAHSRWFGRLLERLGAPQIETHWSDALFTWVRRAGGLHFELVTFLTAEIIAQRFFGLLSKSCPEATCARVFAQVVRDESAHIAFHIDTLRRAFENQNAVRRTLWKWTWQAMLAGAILIVCLDQSAIFRELKLSRRDFAARCFEIFDVLSARIWTQTPPLALSPLHLFSRRD